MEGLGEIALTAFGEKAQAQERADVCRGLDEGDERVRLEVARKQAANWKKQKEPRQCAQALRAHEALAIAAAGNQAKAFFEHPKAAEHPNDAQGRNENRCLLVGRKDERG
jgi:hypothetical protein